MPDFLNVMDLTEISDIFGYLLTTLVEYEFFFFFLEYVHNETSQELRMLSSVTINCQVTKIVMNPGSQLSVL